MGIFITGVENLYSDHCILDSFILLLRSCSLYFPDWLKFVLTIEKRESKAANIEKIIELLSTKNIVEIKDSDLFESEGKSYLEFALSYGIGASNRGQTPDTKKVGGGETGK